MKQIKLGQQGEDTITGFKGTIISKIEYLNDTTQYMLQPPVGKDNKFV